MLHYEGELYILSAAFAHNIDGFGSRDVLYMGLDARPLLHRRDTLEDIVPFEPLSPTYRRIPVHVSDGFLLTWETPEQDEDEFGEETPKVATLHAVVEFSSEKNDFGRVNNYFLTTAESGTDGKLIMSSPLKRPLDFWENTRLTTEMLISLRPILFSE